MKVVIQRVEEASVRVAGEVCGQIGPGFLLLVGIKKGDGPAELEWMAQKILGLRCFQDQDGKMNWDLDAVGGSILAVSQFTLLGDLRRGRRPHFLDAAEPREAAALFDAFVARLRSGLGESRVETGRFGAAMKVSLVNDGPVTFVLERDAPGDDRPCT